MLLPKSQSLAGFRCSVDASGSRVQLILWSLWSLNTTNFHFHFGRKEQYQPIPKIACLSKIFSLTLWSVLGTAYYLPLCFMFMFNSSPHRWTLSALCCWWYSLPSWCSALCVSGSQRLWCPWIGSWWGGDSFLNIGTGQCFERHQQVAPGSPKIIQPSNNYVSPCL